MGTTGGMLQSAYDDLLSCWTDHAQYDSNNDDIPDASLDTDGDGIPDQPWKMTLPVIDCPGNNTGNCSTLLSAVTVNVVWITRTDKNKMVEVPRKMGDWTCATGSTGQQCWNSFVNHFKLHDVLNETPATYEDKTIYLRPDCTPHKPEGTSGGINTGILAEIPILVK